MIDIIFQTLVAHGMNVTRTDDANTCAMAAPKARNILDPLIPDQKVPIVRVCDMYQYPYNII